MRHIPLAGALRVSGRNALRVPGRGLASGRRWVSGRRWSATTTKAVTLGLALVTGTVMLPVSAASAQSAPDRKTRVAVV
jgi:hypothetical protein